MRHLVAYTARTSSGTETGVAEVLSDHDRPSWHECAQQIPGYVTGHYMGPATTYRLRYRTSNGVRERILDRTGVERVGRVVMGLANRDMATDIEVLDGTGVDVTFDFACFC